MPQLDGPRLDVVCYYADIGRPYQPLMRDHVLDNPRSGLFVPMGMGKTTATLSAIVALLLVEELKVLWHSRPFQARFLPIGAHHLRIA